jgi:hypothetical protein
MSLRTLLECFVTLAYMGEARLRRVVAIVQGPRVGQAKLAFIELEEGEDRLGYVKTEALERLANEDMWQEFVPINLGHWEKTNLRTMSQQGNVKVEYDQYYGWTSTFSHGHWGPCAILSCKLARILCTACTGYGGHLRERWKMWRPMLVGL